MTFVAVLKHMAHFSDHLKLIMCCQYQTFPFLQYRFTQFINISISPFNFKHQLISLIKSLPTPDTPNGSC